MEKQKLLVTKPSNPIDGMNAVYNALEPFLVNKYNLKFFLRGHKGISYQNILLSYLSPCIDLIRFFFVVVSYHPTYVLINTSLNKRCIVRDGLYTRLCKKLGKKVILFIHGFDKRLLIKKQILSNGFYQANKIIVLAQEFKKKLKENGCMINVNVISNPISLSIDEVFNDNFFSTKTYFPITNLLFLSRIERAKGIFLAVDVFKRLSAKYPYLKFHIAGDGTCLQAVKEYVSENKIKNVFFYGFVQGKDKINLLMKSQVFFFPSYNEGFPMALLEAMDAGLVIVSSSVGGTKDFFENGKMGYLLKDGDVSKYYYVLDNVISRNQAAEMGLYNHYYVKDHFHPQIIASHLIDIIEK